MKPPVDELQEFLAEPSLVDPDQVRFLREGIARSPEPETLARFLLTHGRRNGLPRDRSQLLALLLVAGQSPFLGNLLLKNPEYLARAVREQSRRDPGPPEDLREDLARFRFTLSTLPEGAILRRFKYREYVGIALRDFVGTSELGDTVRDLSLLADTLLQEACLSSLSDALNRFGPPQYTDEQGRISEATFAVMSLGKLGGEELNYSSDIDLVYVYSREGQTTGIDGIPETVVSNREFFTRVAEGLTARIAGISPEGQVFRVDLGLRPGGKDGELVHSFRSMIAYYRTWARTWERQALIKARFSAGDPVLGLRLLRELGGSAYPRRKTPFAALEIKEMKDRIDSELSRSGRNEIDIKLGRGGLRELEFAVQALQLTHGGESPWLREGNTLRALHRLADRDLISYGEHFSLSRAYVFLRRVEHRLQLERNRQTYLLPTHPATLRTLARRLGFLQEPEEAECFRQELESHRQVVRSFYDAVFSRAAQVSLDEPGRDPLLDSMEEEDLRRLLAQAGAVPADEVVPHLNRIRRLLSPERIRPEDRRDIRRVSAGILHEALNAGEPERALSNLERFLSTLLLDAELSRSFFRKAEWIPPVIRLFGRSEHLSQILIRRPEILSDLGTVPDSFRERAWDRIARELNSRLAQVTEVREAAAVLRRCHDFEVLLIGMRDVHRQDSLARTLRSLTRLADACLSSALDTAFRIFAAGENRNRFCVLGLGRLGYRELDYNSDLDLIFVADPDPATAGGLEKIRRAAEILIHLLTAVTREGSLYSVDLRLRPAGTEGELVPTRQRVIDYFRETARTWEKMAFLKARPVAGDPELGREVLDSVQALILEGTDRSQLAGEVQEMKKHLEQAAEGARGETIPLKLGRGGLMDIHFLVEFLQIAHHIPGPAEKDTLRMLTHLHGQGFLPDEDYHRLYTAYVLLLTLDHSMRLLYDRPGDQIPTSTTHLAQLAADVNRLEAPAGNTGGESLLPLLQETRESVRRSFRSLVR